MSKTYILLIGASSDMGCEIIREMNDDNVVILAHYHTGREKIEAIASEGSSKVIPICADLRTERGVEMLIEGVEAECSYPGKIVHLSAPKISNARFKDLSWKDFQNHLDIQVRTIAMVLNRFLPRMAKEKKGKVVFMLSSYTLGVPPAALAHYVTAKYALLGLMKALASEYADKNIMINAVSPSMVETNYLSEIPEILVEMTAQKHPLKRNATPSDIAPLIKFLLSPESDYMTGVNIPVAGGLIF